MSAAVPIQGDVKASVDFFKRWRPEGPWVITAIKPEQTGLESETYGPGEEGALAAWIEARQGKDNIYFTVNPLMSPMKGKGAKAKKTDVKSMAWLHTDLDPRPMEPGGDPVEHLRTERERALKLLREYNPPPTLIIDSGGGYQAFWKLSEEQPVNGDEAKAIELEGYNLQIEITLSADKVHNLDRVMRLPGTLNVPNEKKRAKGRTLSLASIVEWHEDRVYPVATFQRTVVRFPGAKASSPQPQIVKLNPGFRLGSLDELPEKVSPRTKMLIVQGEDPDDPQRYPSRSEACFAVVCEMVRSDCTDDQINAVLLDPDYGVSKHVLHQNKPAEYALRQIRRAREQAVNPWLQQLNDKHAVIEDVGGRCRVVSEIYDRALKRYRLSLQSFDDFRNRYMHISIQVGRNKEGEPIMMPVGKYWLLNEHRRQFQTIVFSPKEEHVDDAYNLWKGFACDTRPGDCSLLLQHIKENLCGGNEEYNTYLLNWMASAVQHPDKTGEVAVVLRGKMGTGKGVFCHSFGSIWGRHYLHVSNPKHLVGQFNSHLRDCVVLFGDEAFFAGDKSHESVLKTLITERMLMTEAKGIDAEQTPNFVHLLLASNSDWVVPAMGDERRFFVLDVAETQAQNTEYFAAIVHQMEKEGGKEALLHMLKTRDITGWDVRKAPQTEALRDQKMESMSPLQQWWYDKLQDARIMLKGDPWPKEISKDAIFEDMNKYFDRAKVNRRPSATMLQKQLAKWMPDGKMTVTQRMSEVTFDDGFGMELKKKARVTFFSLAPVTECRLHWSKITKSDPAKWMPIPEDEPDIKPPF